MAYMGASVVSRGGHAFSQDFTSLVGCADGRSLVGARFPPSSSSFPVFFVFRSLTPQILKFVSGVFFVFAPNRPGKRGAIKFVSVSFGLSPLAPSLATGPLRGSPSG